MNENVLVALDGNAILKHTEQGTFQGVVAVDRRRRGKRGNSV